MATWSWGLTGAPLKPLMYATDVSSDTSAEVGYVSTHHQYGLVVIPEDRKWSSEPDHPRCQVTILWTCPEAAARCTDIIENGCIIMCFQDRPTSKKFRGRR
eukprot:scpid103599/ scgid15240/ 